MKRLFCLGMLAAVITGCGAADFKSAGSAPMAKAVRMDGERGGGHMEAAADMAPMEQKPGGQPAAPDRKPADFQRKIIYTATLTLIVDDFADSKRILEMLVKEEPGAFIAKSDVSGSPGLPRRGSWTVRVPVEKLEAFVAAVTKIGELERSTLDAKDVTEEYYDVEADIRNKKVEEEAFLNLEKTAVNFDQLVTAKREVNRVRTEIDRQQKRLNVLATMAAMSTVHLTLAERKGYVPETTAGFGTSIGRTFSGSLDALGSFGKGIVLVVVAVLPWLPVLALVFGVPFWLFRRWLARRQAAIPMVVAAPETQMPG